MIIIRRDATMPPGALGTADDGIVVLDPATGEECPPIEREPRRPAAQRARPRPARS